MSAQAFTRAKLPTQHRAETAQCYSLPPDFRRAPVGSCAAGVKRTVVNLLGVADDECDIMTPTACGGSATPQWIYMLNELQERGLGSIILLLATAVSLTLTNLASTAAWWLPFWSTPVGPMVGGHALSPRGWVCRATLHSPGPLGVGGAAGETAR